MISLVIGMLGVVMAAMYMGYLVYIRINRNSVMAKYTKHKGTPVYDDFMKLFSTRRLVISAVILIFFVISLAYGVINGLKQETIEPKELLLFAVLILGVVGVTFVVHVKGRQ